MIKYALLLLLATGICLADDEALEDRDWRLVETDNFRVHSVLSAERTSELLRQLEAMRVALGDDTSDATYQAVVPTIIFAIDNEPDYLSIGVPQGTVGFFVAHLRENAIVVLDNAKTQGVRTILHEYVHYLTSRHGRIDYPRWYEEGLAEYLSASQLSDDVFEYGLPRPLRMASLAVSGWIPMQQFLQVRSIDELDDAEGDLFLQPGMVVGALPPQSSRWRTHDRKSTHEIQRVSRCRTWAR